MSATQTIQGRMYYCVEYGPFLLASDAPFDAKEIDEGSEEVWHRIGVVVDPRVLNHDLVRVRRFINAFMLMEGIRPK